ncbi:MAG: DUF1844 domain-containing protein [Planctomycetota bacterium]
MEESGDPPKIQIDSDWKAQAQAEKKKLAAQSADTAGASGSPTPGPGEGQLPPTNFETLLSTFITQALFAMGAIPDPQTGQPVLHLDLARHHIDMLTVLEDKTKNNLTEEETKLLSGALYELRSRYVEVANAARGG